MLKCDIAVQLRRSNLGESSGVVPTLLALGIPTIVSPIGAFAEYGDAVLSFDGYDPVALADLLERGQPVDQLAMQRYARDHSLAAYNAKLLSVLGVEAPLWTEAVTTVDEIEYLVFPRLAAIAEIAWSMRSTHDWSAFRHRLGAQAPRWEALGVNFARVPGVPWGAAPASSPQPKPHPRGELTQPTADSNRAPR